MENVHKSSEPVVQSKYHEKEIHIKAIIPGALDTWSMTLIEPRKLFVAINCLVFVHGLQIQEPAGG